MRRGPFVVVCMLALPACYTFQPVAVEELEPGMEVRAQITAAQASEFQGVLADGARTLDGRVVRADGQAGSIQLSVPATMTERSGVRRTFRQEVEIAPSGLLEVEIRELNERRTYLLMGGALALAGGVILHQVTQGGSGRSEVVDPSPPSEWRAPPTPWFRIPM